ncbi:3-carboxy-cis,cis-muconate cycloisomerase [Sinosporangium siamense]|uniref:3-carboxy-cis,cis-muconate cycloisomerase n=1 Tax=Sinosporangium siamense TaxID=1367973 RepID=A0A919RND9_9ACTN|nr:3-carboxy-cis,cis-muconate cycloisomerase [Sinosporangium siamense]GII96743.1 3-carboxy-cis,cis-muconate cycloisomerase [Sinosporangium siamense]
MTSDDDLTRGADLGLLSPMGSAWEDTGDLAVLRAMLDAEVALIRARATLGLAPPEAAAAVERAALVELFDLPDLIRRSRSGGNPVIPLVEDLRAAVAVGEHASHVHRGATSQDILDSALMLVSHRALGPVLTDLRTLATMFAGLAAEHRDTPMAARTLTQQAVPTTFGLKAAGWRKLTLDAHARAHAVRLALPGQLGGPAGTLEEPHGLAVAARFCAALGLAEPVLPWHVLRTPVADLANALAFAAGALGKFAADVLVLSRTEIGELSEGVGGGSSSMPHKHNPVRATMIAAAARQVPALAAVLYGSLAAEDERPAGAWHAEWQPLRTALRLVAGAARDAVELAGDLRVHAERMHANLTVHGGTGAAGALVDRALKEE